MVYERFFKGFPTPAQGQGTVVEVGPHAAWLNVGVVRRSPRDGLLRTVNARLPARLLDPEVCRRDTSPQPNLHAHARSLARSFARSSLFTRAYFLVCARARWSVLGGAFPTRNYTYSRSYNDMSLCRHRGCTMVLFFSYHTRVQVVVSALFPPTMD